MKIAVDVTPIRPGGQCGGAKTLVFDLLRQLARASKSHRYVLLTAEWNHEEFSALDGPLVSRAPIETLAGDAERRARRLLARLFGRPVGTPFTPGPLRRLGFDLLFCPMTDPVHAEPDVPTVSVVYDLQHRAYPYFFDSAEVAHRDRVFERVIRSATRCICISEFTRRTLVEMTGYPENRAVAIPVAVHDRFQQSNATDIQATLRKLNLPAAPFAFYPANFWPHKNHRILLAAFSRIVHEWPDVPLHLVLTGDLLDAADLYHEAVRSLGIESRVHHLGYVSEAELNAVWLASWCLVFPSLYEGFGIPVVEAMNFGKPVICSTAGSLPEVGGDAAIYVDPRRPEELAKAMAALYRDPAGAAARSAVGRQWAARFRPAATARRYLEVFSAAARQEASAA